MVENRSDFFEVHDLCRVESDLVGIYLHIFTLNVKIFSGSGKKSLTFQKRLIY